MQGAENDNGQEKEMHTRRAAAAKEEKRWTHWSFNGPGSPLPGSARYQGATSLLAVCDYHSMSFVLPLPLKSVRHH